MIKPKKREEELVTDFFLHAFNAQHGFSYETQVIHSEETRVDTRGVSRVPGQLPIDFQVTYADNGLPHEGGSILGRQFRSVGNIIDLTTPYDIAAAIERKQSRYEEEVAEGLVLLVWKTKSCLVDPRGMGWNNEGIRFRACYFVCLPGSGQPGQVLTLKPLVDAAGKEYEVK